MGALMDADDPTYVGGLFVTLQSLLERIETLQSNRRSLASVLAAHSATTNTRKKGMLADFKAKMEMWGLLRLAFSAARVALSKSGISKIASSSFSGRLNWAQRMNNTHY